MTECYSLLQVHSSALVFKPTPKHKNKNKSSVYVKLPGEVQAARHDCSHDCKGAFSLWKQRDFSDNGEVHDVDRTKRREYRKHLRKLLNQIKIGKALNLYNAENPMKSYFGNF